jgi:hypothetical protein
MPIGLASLGRALLFAAVALAASVILVVSYAERRATTTEPASAPTTHLAEPPMPSVCSEIFEQELLVRLQGEAAWITRC